VAHKRSSSLAQCGEEAEPRSVLFGYRKILFICPWDSPFPLSVNHVSTRLHTRLN
jgi:hypothetical protein